VPFFSTYLAQAERERAPSGMQVRTGYRWLSSNQRGTTYMCHELVPDWNRMLLRAGGGGKQTGSSTARLSCKCFLFPGSSLVRHTPDTHTLITTCHQAAFKTT